MPVAVFRIKGEAHIFSPQLPSDLTSLTTALHEVHNPLVSEVLQRSETQTTPFRVEPVAQVGGITQLPDERVKLEFLQVVQSPESALKVLHFLAGSTLLHVPLKNWLVPHP